MRLGRQMNTEINLIDAEGHVIPLASPVEDSETREAQSELERESSKLKVKARVAIGARRGARATIGRQYGRTGPARILVRGGRTMANVIPTIRASFPGKPIELKQFVQELLPMAEEFWPGKTQQYRAKRLYDAIRVAAKSETKRTFKIHGKGVHAMVLPTNGTPSREQEIEVAAPEGKTIVKDIVIRVSIEILPR